MGRIYPIVKARFPIRETVKYMGSTTEHVLNRGDEVRCRWCRKPITLNEETVFRYRHRYDHGNKVWCEYCHNVADAVYYCNSDNQVKLKVWDSNFVKTKMEESIYGNCIT